MQVPWQNNKTKAELTDQKKTAKIGKLNVIGEKNREYWKHDMRTKIYQVKPNGNIIMKNIIEEIKNTMSWL